MTSVKCPLSLPPVTLNQVLAPLGRELPEYNPVVTDLVLDNRRVTQGSVFIALKGHVVDGRRFINAALDAGAAAVLAEADNEREFCEYQNNIPIIYCKNLSEKVSELAGVFFDHPSHRLKVIGVTGTNGKTTCAQLLLQLFQQLGEQTATIGTMGYGTDLSSLVRTGLTTPDAIECQRILAEFVAAGVQRVAMEVSSHAIAQHRVKGIRFEAVLFTNLTRDHLDYHLTMENYAATKARLFRDWEHQYAVVNIDDNLGRKLKKIASEAKRPCLGYGIQAFISSGTSADIHAQNIDFAAGGIKCELQTPWGDMLLRSRLMGRFNLYNLMAAMAIVGMAGYSLAQMTTAIAELEPIAGRMQIVDCVGADICVCVDYAHTPDALEQALLAAREHTHNKLWIVFGCGGDRDRGKRPIMGNTAATLADEIVVTSDNPRTENPQMIVDEIIHSIASDVALTLEMDRKIAIQYAVRSAAAGDLVLIAGKGHEDYQIVGSQTFPFSDYEVAKAALCERHSSTGGHVA